MQLEHASRQTRLITLGPVSARKEACRHRYRRMPEAVVRLTAGQGGERATLRCRLLEDDRTSAAVSTLGSRAVVVLAFLAMMSSDAAAQSDVLGSETPVAFPMAQIATFLFLMLGPTKIIGPFVKVTEGAERELEQKIAFAAIVFSGIALLIAGLLGEIILRKYTIPLPIVALSAGIILFIVAIQDTVRHFSVEATTVTSATRPKPTMKLALDPLAFPVIAPPYGIAALIVFLSFAPDFKSQLQIGGIVLAILAMNLLAMLFATRLVTSIGVALAILGAVLSIVQVALGLQIISNSLKALGAV